MSVYTEEEAKTKWCPFVRFHGTPSDDCVPNRSGSSTDTTRCLGSACMAWRSHVEAWDGPGDPPPNQGWAKCPDDWVPWERTAGFCGLSGKP